MTERRGRWVFATRLVVAVALLAAGHLAVYWVFAGYRGRNALLSPHWYRLMALGLPALLVGAWAWPRRWPAAAAPTSSDAPAGAPTRGNGLFERWIPAAIVLLVVLFRVLPMVSGRVPHGLVWEGHESAFLGRTVLEGISPQMILYSYTNMIIAASYWLLGIGEAALRTAASSLGVLAVLWFAWCSRLHWNAAVALICATVVATTPSLVIASFFAEESLSIVVFIQIALLATMLAAIHARRAWMSVVLGALCGMAVIEYAPVKPGIIVAPIVVYGAHVIAALRAREHRWTRLASAGAGLYLWVLTLAFTSAPMLINAARGDDQFFEGRRSLMVGSGWRQSLEQRLPSLETSLATHSMMLLGGGEEKTGWEVLHGRGVPLAGTVLPVLVAASAVALLVLALSRRRQGSLGQWARRRGGWLVLWTGWAAADLFYCALWNYDNAQAHRLLVVIPLLVLALGEILEGVFDSTPPAASSGLAMTVVALVVLVNGRELLRATGELETRYFYRSKTVNLCSEMDRSSPDLSYLIHWDWDWDGIYLGDTVMKTWIESPSRNGYDSWPCTREHPMRGYDSLPALRAALIAVDPGTAGASRLILAARIRNDQEMFEQGDTDLLQRRLDGYLHELGAPSDVVADCRFFSDSLWYRYALCPIEGWTRGRDGQPGF